MQTLSPTCDGQGDHRVVGLWELPTPAPGKIRALAHVSLTADPGCAAVLWIRHGAGTTGAAVSTFSRGKINAVGLGELRELAWSRWNAF